MVIFNSYVKLPEGIEIQMMMNLNGFLNTRTDLRYPIYSYFQTASHMQPVIIYPTWFIPVAPPHWSHGMWNKPCGSRKPICEKNTGKNPAYDLETASPHHIQNAVDHDCLVVLTILKNINY